MLLVALQKTPSLLGAECQGVGTTPLHANERGQTVRFVAVIEPPVYWGISISDLFYFLVCLYKTNHHYPSNDILLENYQQPFVLLYK